MKHEEQQNTTPIVMKHEMRNDAGEEIISSSVKTSSSGCNTYLSEDMIFNILSSTTCVTSLLRCKSVCKLWQSIISKPEFMKAHHLNSLNKLPSIMMITSRIHDDAGCCGATIVYPNSPEQHSVNVPLMPPFDDLEFIRSCNGVVCVFNYLHGDIYLLNPLTKMSKKLLVPPDAPLNRWKRPCLTKKVDVAFGFDCVSHDFKVLWIQYQATPTHNMDVAAVKLYSTNSDSWSKIEVGIQLPSLLHHPFSPAMRSGPVVNGVLYLEAVNAIITFDLHDELFGLISYPGFIHTRKSSVFDFEGSVAVVLETVPDGSLDEKEIGLWTLVAVSDKVAWNKMFTFGSGSEEIDWVFLYSGANQFFGKTRLGEMLYDYKKKQTKYVGLPSQSFLVRVLNHTESFLSVVSGCGNTYFSKQDKDEQHNTTPIVMKHEEQQNTTPIVMKHEEQQNTTPIVMKHEEQKNTTPIVMKHEEQTSEEGGIILNNNRDNFEEGKAKEDKHKEEEHKTSSNFIKIGDTVDLSDLLFTKKRNFLISYNQQRIEAKDLSGKFVVLHFMSLITPYNDGLDTLTKHLLDIYSKLQPGGDFEIVLVAINDHHVPHYYKQARITPRYCFFEKFSTMPWPAIPFTDLESRKRLESFFENDEIMPRSIIIDPRGVVLQCDADPLFLRYGAAAYPFTNERIQSIDSEDNLLLMQHPLPIQTLLATPERDYLINNNGDQVPLDNLDHKVVGLYFCPCIDKTDELYTTRELKKLYQELSEKTKEFEIVLIYTHGWCDCHEYTTCGRMVEDSFLNEIKTMPWLALPFKDTNCIKKLQRLFQHPQELGDPIPAKLVIIGPQGKFIEPWGTHIFRIYGAPAYPFSLQSAVKLEIEMLQKWKLEMFLDLDTVFVHNNGSQVRFSQYIGKRVIVVFQKTPCESNGFWRDLKARYCKMKGSDDEFEVIHISKGIHGKDKKYAAPMPWFMLPYVDQDSYAITCRNCVWPGNLNLDYTGLIAFDRDGSVVRIKKNPELGDSMVFPFYQDGDMENEVLTCVRKKIKSKFKFECVNNEPEYP